MKGAGRRLDLPPSGGCDGVGRFSGGRDLRLLPPENSGVIYCD